MKSRFLTLTILIVIMLIGSSCGDGKKQVPSDSSTLTILVNWGDRWILGPSWDSNPKFLVFLPLFSGPVNSDETPSALAENWEFSDDYLECTIYLRKNIFWQNSIPVTAHDVKFTYDLWRHPDINYMTSKLEAVEVLDDFTARFFFENPDPTFVTWWSVIYPQHLLKDLDPKEYYTWDFWTHPVGNGPFKFASFSPSVKIELAANPDYFKGKPKIDHLRLKFSSGTAITEVLSGNVDIAPIDNSETLLINKDPRYQVYTDLRMPHNTIYWNNAILYLTLQISEGH